MNKYVTTNGASFHVEHLLSFPRQKDFVDAYVDTVWLRLDKRERRKELGKMYKEAKRRKNEHTKLQQADQRQGDQ